MLQGMEHAVAVHLPRELVERVNVVAASELRSRRMRSGGCSMRLCSGVSRSTLAT